MSSPGAMIPISELPQSATQAMPMQLAQSGQPQVESLPDLPRIPTFDQDAQTEKLLQAPIFQPTQQQQRQLPPTEVLPAVQPVPKPNFGMKLIAGIAAAKGNFGPAFEIQQMERKGTAYTEYLQSRRQFNHLMSQGNDKKAEEVLHESSARALSIAPELKELINADVERLYARQQTSLQVQGLIIAAETKQKRDGTDNQGFIDVLKKSGPFANNPENLKQLLEYAGYTFAPNPSQNQTVRHDKAGGTTVIQLPYSFSEQNLKGPVGDLLVGMTGIPAHEIANAMNKTSVMRGDKDIGPEIKQVMTPLLTQGRAIEAQLELVKAAPYTPEQTQALRQVYKKQGMSDAEANFMTATRGAVPKEFLNLVKGVSGQLSGAGMNADELARQEVVAERRRLLKDAIEVEGDVPMALSTKLQSMVAVHKSGPQQWLPNREITFNQANADPENYGVLTDKVYTDKVMPATITIRDLKQIGDMFAYAGHPKDMVDRLSGGVQQYIKGWTGSSDPRDAKLQVARVLVQRAIEEVKNTVNVPDAEVGKMKSILSGMLAGEISGIAGVQELVRKMEDSINVYIGANSQSVTKELKSTQATPTPSITAINKAAGVVPKGKGQASNSQVLVAGEAVANTIEGMEDINTPIEQSSTYEKNKGQVIGNNSVTGLQVAQVIVSTRIGELQKRGVKLEGVVEKYVIKNTDTKEQVLSKLRESATLIGGDPTSTSVPVPIATPPIGTGSSIKLDPTMDTMGKTKLNPGITHIPRKK